MSASLPVWETGHAQADGALRLAREMDRAKVARCYGNGLLATPTGESITYCYKARKAAESRFPY